MEKVVLSASLRTVTGKQVKSLRRQGQLPAVIYGHGVNPVAITLDAHSTSLILPTISSSHLIEIDVEGQMHTVLVRERQRHPVRGELIHLDFHEVSMTETLRLMVGLSFVGEAPAVKTYNAVVVNNFEEIEIEALPGDLPENLHVDISGLKEIGDMIMVKDIQVPSGVTVLSDMDEIVVVVTPPVSDEEPAEEAGMSEPEVIERGKKEEEF